MSRTGNRTGTKTKIRKWCQGKTKGTLARARRTRYNGPSYFQGRAAVLAERIAEVVEPVSPEATYDEPALTPTGAPRCEGVTRSGTQCRKAALAERAFCAQHASQGVAA